MELEVLECDWGDSSRDDIHRLLEDVASHIARELREPFDETIRVKNLPEYGEPMTFFRNTDNAAFEINLTAKDRNWCQFTYQFGHEFCHVLSGLDRLQDNPNNWFHESICELSSFFVLRRMARRWPTNPPYPNWANHSRMLAGYAENEAKKFGNIARTETLGAWLSENENDMRQNPYLRNRNGIVALRLLPLFEENPQGWNAVRRLPTSGKPIREYVQIWSAEVPAVDRAFVERISGALSE